MAAVPKQDMAAGGEDRDRQFLPRDAL